MRARSLRLSLVVGLACLAGACAPAAPRYTVVPTGEEAPTRPAVASPAAPTGDRQLDAFLAELAAALDRGDWRAVARMLEGPAYAELHEAGLANGETAEAAAARLIAGALGLAGLEPAATPFAGLGQIRVVTLRETTALSDGVVRVEGDVRLADDRRLPLSAFVRRAPDTGSYRIILSRV